MNGPAVGPPSTGVQATGGGTYNLLAPWIAATVGGAIIGVFGTALLAIGLIYTRSLGSINFEAALSVYGVITGLGIGGLQGRVLGSVLPPNILRQWTVVSVAGVTAALIAIRLAWPLIESVYSSLRSVRNDNPFVSPEERNATIALLAVSLICGAVGGLVLGCVQWLVLRRYVRRAAWWIPGSMVAAVTAAISTMLILWVQSAVYLGQGLRGVYVFLIGVVCIPWPIIAGITGWMLIQLLRRSGGRDASISSN